MIKTIAPGITRVLNRRVPLKPIFAIVFLALVYAIWFPTINVALRWRPHRIANFAGHKVDVPFLWYEDTQPSFALRRPGSSIFNPLDDRIELTLSHVRTDQAATHRLRWLYIRGLAARPPEEDARRSAMEDMIRQLDRPLAEFKLTPQWKCARLVGPTEQMVRVECISEDSSYILRYNGSPASLEEFKRVAEQLEIPILSQNAR